MLLASDYIPLLLGSLIVLECASLASFPTEIGSILIWPALVLDFGHVIILAILLLQVFLRSIAILIERLLLSSLLL